MSNYIPSADFDFKGSWIKPSADFNFGASESEVIKVYPSGLLSLKMGFPTLSSSSTYIKPTGVFPPDIGRHAIRLGSLFVGPVGIDSAAISKPSIVNRHKEILVKPIDSALYGKPSIYNKLQYIQARGLDSLVFGNAYLIGGVKYLYPRSYDASAIGRAELVNTTATQAIKPSGINSLYIPKPNVSPRMLYAKGFSLLAMGAPDVRSPVLLPKGLIHSKYGNTTVWYHTRSLSPTGIDSFESGYPKAFDPTRFITPSPLNRTAVFGDTGIKNKSVFIRPKSIFDEVVTPWTLVENNRRYYVLAGINSQAFGETGIANKTPSVFPKSIELPPLGTPAIGHRIRSVKPIGFDGLLVGAPALTKTPELSPKGHASSVVAPPTIWYKNRVVNLSQKGINSFKSGAATAWFRYRYVTPESWASSVFAEPVLSHGLRNINALGFVRDAYGNAWVSRGTRFIEPPSIVRISASNHMVGGTRHIKPDGYIATKWGTRVIPESQSVAPFGFTGIFGQSQIRLHTRYLKPFGYISVGNQPADRWGSAKLYNKRQYITQFFDNASGLVPPKWSDWQTVENRNKTIAATGFFSQKIGYSKIDNHAAPLLVKGISPPTGGRFDVSMISHANRPIAPPAIEAPIMSTWAVAHNAARVISAKGVEHTLFGLARAEKTRRYYDRVGRIDSFESGTPMISFRIRTIDVEKRYSIAPPIIRLPTIDLHTRYASFRGFETAQYGMPSLSIHFNNISPGWSHRDYVGEPSLRNVTPEVGQRGHNSEAFGNTSLRTQWRNVYAQGDRATLFGDARIADTKQYISVISWQDTRVNQRLLVTKTGTNPYVTQNIWDAGGFSLDGSNNQQVPKPGLNQNVIYPKGINSQSFGGNRIWSNNIYVDIGIAIVNVSKNLTVSNKVRFIDLNTENLGISPTVELGEPVLSPHTIRQYHDQFSKADGEVFGRSVVVPRDRNITQLPSNGNQLRVGLLTISLKRNYIKPNPIRAGAIGIPSIPFTPKELSAIGADNSLFGNHLISYPPYTGSQEIKPIGLNSFKSEKGNSVDLLNRRISAKGHDSLLMGVSKTADTPFMWQGLRVGEHVPLVIGAGDMSAFGKAFISLRVREIPVKGFVAFRSEYTLEAFDKRMKVKGTTPDYVEDINIGVTGIDSMQIGSVGVKWGQQFIRPDGNSDQFRKGGYSG